MTTDEEKLKKIKGILDRAINKAEPSKLEYVKDKDEIIGVCVNETAAETMLRIEKNFVIYVNAIEKIDDIFGIRRRKQIINE
jgi:hypothetical protein